MKLCFNFDINLL